MSISSSTISSIISNLSNLSGFSEEGEIMLNLKKITYNEDIKDYNDNKIANELKNLINVNFNDLHGRINYYEKYFNNLVQNIRKVIADPFIRCDESLYTLIRKNIFPLIYVKPINQVELNDDNTLDDTQEFLWKYLQDRQFLILGSDSQILMDTRLYKHACPFKSYENIDKKWNHIFVNDIDSYIIDENNNIIRSIRLIGPTFSNLTNEKVNIYKGDEVAFKGFMYYGNVDNKRDHIKTFDIDNYINNVKNFRPGDDVKVYFNVDELINGKTESIVSGKVVNITKYLITIQTDSTKIYYSNFDFSVNNCFIYSSEYKGEFYSKKLLFNSNWMFITDEEPMKPFYLESIIFPNIGESIDIFPDLKNITNYRDVKQLLGNDMYGYHNTTRLSDTIKNKLKSLKDGKIQKKNKSVNFKYGFVSDIQIFKFDTYSKFLKKYFNSYELTNKFIDSNSSRFNHISSNKHMLYAYSLNVLLKTYPKKFQLVPVSKKIKTDKFRYQNDQKIDVKFFNLHEMMTSKDNKESTFGYVIDTNDVYIFKNGYWQLHNLHEKYFTFPKTNYAIDINAIDNELYKSVVDMTKVILDEAVSKRNYYLEEIQNDININFNIGKSFAKKRKNLEYNYYNLDDDDDKLILGVDNDTDELVLMPEVYNNVESDMDKYVYIDESVVKLFDEPIGKILKLFIDLFEISIESQQLKIILYNITKYDEFKKIKDQLLQKEKGLRLQVQLLKNKNKDVNNSKIEEMISQRLKSFENEFMSEYYAKSIIVSISFIVIYIQTNLPTINIKPVKLTKCNASFSYKGFPFDNEPKSLIQYLICVIKTLYNDLGQFKLASTALNKMNIENEIVNHINNILNEKPHYKYLLIQAKKRTENMKMKTEHINVFEGFRPNEYKINKLYGPLNIEDILMQRQYHPQANACCLNNVTNLQLKKKIIKRNKNNKSTLKSYNKDIFVFNESNNKFIIHNANIIKRNDVSTNQILSFNSYIKEYVSKFDALKSDDFLKNIINNDSSNAGWNELSSIVSIRWNQLFGLLNINDDNKSTLIDFFVYQEQKFTDHTKVKQMAKHVIDNIIPSILGKCVNRFTVDTVYVDNKKYLKPEERNNIINHMMGMETNNLILLMNNSDINKVINNVYTNFYSDSELVCESKIEQVYKHVLFYNYIILKSLYSILDLDVCKYDITINVKHTNLIKFNQVILNEIIDYIKINYINIDELQIEFEKQRENVKQELMRKMEKLSQEDKQIFYIAKEKFAFNIDYVDEVQKQANEIREFMVQNINDGDVDRDEDDIPMDWIGENPDEIELEDDNSGY
jgi:hypothetical protein